MQESYSFTNNWAHKSQIITLCKQSQQPPQRGFRRYYRLKTQFGPSGNVLMKTIWSSRIISQYFPSIFPAFMKSKILYKNYHHHPKESSLYLVLRYIVFSDITTMSFSSLRWMNCNHIPSKMWDDITCPFPNFIGATSNFDPHFIMDVITFSCWD